MKETLLRYLICPACGGDLRLAATARDGREVMTGGLTCAGCRAAYPIRGGVPRFATTEADPGQRATAENFGAQWLAFDEVEGHHEEQFRDWIAPVTPEFVRGRCVIEAGCGKGRHTRAVAGWGARDVVGVDLSAAVEAAFRHTRDLPNAHIIQADIYHLPLRPVFDYAFSVGVLHHLPDPGAGFEQLIRRLRPGGAVSAWVYGRENNGWIVHLVNPLRRHLTSRLPFRVLYPLSFLPAALLYTLIKGVYGPLGRAGLGRRLFYGDYLGYIARFPFREIHNIVFDHLTAPVAFYISRDEFGDWFRRARAERVEISWHNRNSWRGFGFVGAAAGAEARYGR
ncbi:MAG TPA: methyltransferase domain-containing protein [Blastocatellia bacterium]|nr:methyltransferase domain-containing protein [Blastocatellia bacterium]